MDSGEIAAFEVTLLKAPFWQLDRWEFDSKGDPYWRLYWNDRPGATATSGSQVEELRPDRLVLIPEETGFSGRLSQPVRHFFPTFLTSRRFRMRQLFHFPLSAGERRAVEQLAAGGGDPILRSLRIRALVYDVLARLPADRFSVHRLDPRIEKVCGLLESRLDGYLSNDALARASGLSTNAFIRLFTESVGRPPQAWFLRLKIDRACVLLRATNRSIEQIAEELGFCDRYHFSRMFRKLRETSPARYRKEAIS